MKVLLKKHFQLIKFSTLVFLLLLSLSGQVVSKDRDIYQEVSKFTIRPYKNGIYLTQEPSGIFYNFSIKDAYYTSLFGDRENFVEDKIESEESKKIRNRDSFYSKLFSVLSYFDVTKPTATFKLNNKDQIQFITKVHKNKLNLIYSGVKVSNPVLTLSFNENDFVFDNDLRLYSKNSFSHVQEFSKINSIPFTFNETESTEIELEPTNTTLFIVNSETSGIIKVSSSINEFKKLQIDLNNKLVEFFTADGENPEIEITLYGSLKEALL